jgi:hypothetical protein
MIETRRSRSGWCVRITRRLYKFVSVLLPIRFDDGTINSAQSLLHSRERIGLYSIVHSTLHIVEFNRELALRCPPRTSPHSSIYPVQRVVEPHCEPLPRCFHATVPRSFRNSDKCAALRCLSLIFYYPTRLKIPE